MKKSRSSSSSKRRERSRTPPQDSKSKKVRHRSKSREKEKVKKEDKAGPRKTRWQAADDKDAPKNTPDPSKTSSSEKKKDESGPPLLRIRDLLHDREKVVDLLFQTVTGAALQELIPDYLKNRPEEELKKLCLLQIKDMTNEDILLIISGKVESSNKDFEKEQVLKPEKPSPDVAKEEVRDVTDVEKKDIPSEELSSDKSGDLKEDDTKTETALEEENVIPLVIKDEIAKDLIEPERDAELLELEMRARAIRSLLKSKAQAEGEPDME